MTRRQVPAEIQFVWEDPPTLARGVRATLADRLSAELGKLKRRPDTWAQLVIYATPSSAGSARANLRRQLGDDDWEFVARTLDDGRGAVYGRYIGGDQ